MNQVVTAIGEVERPLAREVTWRFQPPMASPIGRVWVAGVAIVVLMAVAIAASVWRSEVAATAANMAIGDQRQVALSESGHDALFDSVAAVLATGRTERSRRAAIVSTGSRLAGIMTELGSSAAIDGEDRQLLHALNVNNHALMLLEGTTVTARRPPQPAAAAKLRTVEKAIDGDLDRFDKSNAREATAAAADANSAHREARTIALVVGGLAVLLVLVLVAYVIRVVGSYLTQMVADAKTLRSQMQDVSAARLETLQRLALATEYRDRDTGDHTERVGALAGDLAERLGLSPDEVDLIRLAAPLHDIGKVGVSDSILLKQGPLTDGERAEMQLHTTIGGAILHGSQSPVLRLGGEIALGHHEQWDGNGYPKGLSGDQIPLPARIVAVADVFDALTHDRPYKRAWPILEAVQEIVSQAGRHFDPRIAEALPAVVHVHDDPSVAGEAPSERTTSQNFDITPSDRRAPSLTF